MTDNEIIKALEEHYKQVDKGYSTHLEYGGKCDEHEEKYIYMLRDVLDLINRQKAEIERLEKDSKRLKKVQMQLDDAMKMYNVIKAEAYKEFAERLKDKHRRITDYDEAGFGAQIFIVEEKVIDNLLNELVGDKE